MSEPTTFYIQSKWSSETGWGPPFEKSDTVERGMEYMKSFRERFPKKEFRLVKLVEVA